jgi:hypothetical protein
MDAIFQRRSFTGCEHIATLTTGGLYLTDAELTGDGLTLLFRRLDPSGDPVPEEPLTPPNFQPPEAMSVDFQVVVDDEVQKPTRSGTLGSLMDGVAVFRYDIPLTEELKVDVHTPDGRTVTVNLS